MTFLYTLVGVVSIAMLVYLVVVLMKPESF